MSEQYSVTSAGVTPAEDRARRMRMYFIAMSLRVVCIASLFWVRGWWILLAAAGSVILPWFAVLVANAVDHSGDGDRPEAPTPLELTGSTQSEADTVRAGTPESPEALIIIDAPAERRKSGDHS
jgi:hypothetical protein